MTVSIITALYNHEPFIAQAIESVLAQTYADWELIIWDDGSKDQSLDIARHYSRKYPDKIKVFIHEGGANQGQENTRNAAIKKASGKYLGLLDSDDFYLPRKLELLVGLLERNPQAGLAYGRADVYLHESSKQISSGIRIEPQGNVFGALVEDNFICAGATLFRSECIESGLQFDPNFRTIGEYPLWIKIARDWEFISTPEVVAVWREHGNNLGTQLALQAKRELVELAQRLAQDKSYSRHRDEILRALAKKRYDYANEFYSRQDLSSARFELVKTLATPNASAEIRAKASVLLAATLLGKAPNRMLSKVKRALWNYRHPFAAEANKSMKRN